MAAAVGSLGTWHPSSKVVGWLTQELSTVYTTAASREAAAAPSAAGAETDRTKVLGGAAFGAADARP